MAKYVVQDRLEDKETYHDIITASIKQMKDSVTNEPTYNSRVFLDRFFDRWETTLSLDYCLITILNGSDYLDRMEKSYHSFSGFSRSKWNHSGSCESHCAQEYSIDLS